VWRDLTFIIASMLKDYCYMTTMNYIGTYMLSALIIRTSY